MQAEEEFDQIFKFKEPLSIHGRFPMVAIS